MPDAIIPSLAPYGLDVVPGYRVDELTGAEDPNWRSEWFTWRDAVREHRLWVQETCHRDQQFRADHLALCKNDPAYFITMWLVVEEPRGEDAAYADVDGLDDVDDDAADWSLIEEPDDADVIMDFIPFAYQVELIQLFATINASPRRLDVYISKARGIGVSYVILAAAYWAFLFRPWRGIFLSDKLERADRSMDLSSMFGKVDLFFYYTPNWMRPKGWNAKSTKHRQAGMFKNPENGIGQLTAVATTPEAGRGDRARFSASDESAFQEHFGATHATLEGTVRHRWAWSSESYAKGRQWQRAWQAARTHERQATAAGKRPVAKVIELDWYLNPYQNRQWYDETRARMAAAGQASQFSVEYLRNPDDGYSTLIYPEVKRCPDVPGWFEPDKMLFGSWDPGTKDATAVSFWQTHFSDGHKVVRWIDSHERAGPPAEFWSHFITGLWPREGDRIWPVMQDEWGERLFGDRERYFMTWLAAVRPGMLWMCGDPAMAATGGGGHLYQHKENSWMARFMAETRRLRESRGIDPPIPVLVHHRELYKRNRHHDRRTALHEALVYSEFSTTEGAQELKQAIGSVRLQEMTEKSTTAPGWIHDGFTHRCSTAEFGMGYETMKLTAGEIAQPKLQQLAGIKRRGVTPTAQRRDPYAASRSRLAQTLIEVA